MSTDKPMPYPDDIVQWNGGTGVVIVSKHHDRMVAIEQEGVPDQSYDDVDILWRGSWPDNMLHPGQLEARAGIPLRSALSYGVKADGEVEP